ncbi:hypothetical protein SK128_012476 [Halocaridina rubra]|uniref:Uncharacterized protein n=1 Tax=Halocaridina rubra TaxID=373956 RepID=A0AAN8WKG5_HALRR
MRTACTSALVVAAALLGVATAINVQNEESKPEVKIFAGYITRTRFSVITSTSLASCLSALGSTGQCGGRKKRSPILNIDDVDVEPSANDLEGSVDEHSLVKREAALPENKDVGKLFVSLTTFTTHTTTSFTENTSTTVSMSFQCTPPDGNKMPFC